MKLGSRQILFFLAAVAPVGKLILLPPQLAAASGNDLLYPVFLQILVQTALVFCVLLLSRRERTVYGLLKDGIGSTGAKIGMILISVFLLYAAFMPLVEQKLLVQSIFYDTIPSYIVFTPFFLLSAYLCSRPLACTGRIWDILAPLFLFGMAGILLFSVGEADYGALLPFGAQGWSGFTDGTMRACAWFFDAALLLPFVGRFGYKKGLAWKGALCYLGGGALLLVFLATFYGVFSDIAIIQVFAFAKMSHFFAGLTVLGRIDYLFIFALAFVMVFYAALPLHGAVQMIHDAFHAGKPFSALLSTGINLMMLTIIYMFNFDADSIVSAISGTLFWIMPAIGAAVIMLLLAFCGRSRREV